MVCKIDNVLASLSAFLRMPRTYEPLSSSSNICMLIDSIPESWVTTSNRSRDQHWLFYPIIRLYLIMRVFEGACASVTNI